MTTEPPFTTPKKKRSILWWLAGAFVLLVCLFLFQLFGPNPKIIISKQTTYITGPLRSDGLPDYARYYLEISRRDVTPEKNAAVLLYQALGPSELNQDDALALANELGLADVPAKETTLQSPDSAEMRHRAAAWLNEQGRLSSGSPPLNQHVIDELVTESTKGLSDEAEQIMGSTVDPAIDQVFFHPWTSNQFPPFAEWLERNQKSLDLIVAASNRPQYYWPSPDLLNHRDDRLVSMALPDMLGMRHAAHALRVRAMWHLGAGKPLDAWQDVLAIYRLARLQNQQCSLVGLLISISIEGIASSAAVTVLEDPKLTPDEARQIQLDLDTLPKLSAVPVFDRDERLMALKLMVHAGATGDISAFSEEDAAAGSKFLNVVSIDWNTVLREFNVYCDQLVAIASIPNRQHRAAARDKFKADFQLASDQGYSVDHMLAAAFSQRRRSQVASTFVNVLLIPSYKTAFDATDRNTADFDLTRAAATLAVYHAERGVYPQRLSDLAVNATISLPTDPFTNKSFIYVPDGSGFLLYSLGPNGTDDGGSNEMQSIYEGYSLEDLQKLTPPQTPRIPADADDIAIRVPQLAPPALQSTSGK